jgi:hypothetical protein
MRAQHARLTSARVGVGSVCMDCSMWLATITGLPACRHRITISFCARGRGTATGTKIKISTLRNDSSCCY